MSPERCDKFKESKRERQNNKHTNRQAETETKIERDSEKDRGTEIQRDKKARANSTKMHFIRF